MHILFAILSVLGWVLLVFVCLVLVVIFTPARLVLELRYDTFTAKMKVLWFTFYMYPRKKEGQAAARQKNRKQQPESGKAGPQNEKDDANTPAGEAKTARETEPQGPGLPSLRELAQICSAAGVLMRALLRAVHVRGVTAVWPVHCEDAAETAIHFGRTQAYLGSALGVLQNFVDIRLKQVDIIPDFTGEHKYRRYFYCKIQATPFIIGVTGMWALARLRAMHAI